ncbi:hypothetical protein CPC08DRAFT_779526 [Agrocybe pediades]|nr:hypothetical protein CPC08DRAFT_779526 [Agrocybe pediades]
MKLSVQTFISFMLCITLALARGQTCGDPRQAIALLRSDRTGFNVDYYLTTSPANISQSISAYGFTERPTVGYIFESSQPGTVPFARLYSFPRLAHWYTISETEIADAVNNEGYINEGIAGYVYPDETCGGVPLYSAYNPHVYAHLYTVSREEVNNATQTMGYEDTGVAAYILPP